MVKVKRDVISADDVKTLLDYYHTNKSNNVKTPDAIRQRINLNDPTFPRELITSIVDTMLDQPHEIEYLAFLHSQKPFGIHTHGDIKLTNLYNIVSIMLQISDDDQQNGTVFFKNYLEGKPAIFNKSVGGTYPGNMQHISDYTVLPDYVDTDFPVDLHEKYLGHMNIDDVNGLTFDEYVDWIPGSVMTFPRRQLHCTSSGNSNKISILVATLTK